MCGEKINSSSWETTKGGSPPRVRGKDTQKVYINGNSRITPACAGKRTAWEQPFCAGGDHPRVCGEKTVRQLWCPVAIGSPPRVRGKVNGNYSSQFGIGITPACAGKRYLHIVRPIRCWDHPRVCGEKMSGGDVLSQVSGSPPRVRGKASSHLCYFTT